MSPLDLRPFDMVDYIRDEEACQMLMEEVLEDGHPALIAAARKAITLWKQRRGEMDPVELLPYDIAEALTTETMREEFLRATIEDGIPSLIEEARRIVERSRQLQEDWHATGTENHDHDAGRDESGL